MVAERCTIVALGMLEAFGLPDPDARHLLDVLVGVVKGPPEGTSRTQWAARVVKKAMAASPLGTDDTLLTALGDVVATSLQMEFMHHAIEERVLDVAVALIHHFADRHGGGGAAHVVVERVAT